MVPGRPCADAKESVANGARPDPRACSLCHLSTGDGHPESAGISGLPAAYILRQLNEFANGGRVGPRTGAMALIAAGFKGDYTKDAKEAAEYFAARKPRPGYVKVIEAAMVPKTFVGEGAMRFVTTGASAGEEPIGQRIITVPQDKDGAEARNPRTGFDHFVPPGAIKKGEELAKTGGNGKTVACAVCHGEGLHGLGEVPPIASRDLLYTRAPAQRHPERRAHRQRVRPDAPGRRQIDHGRHDLARRLRGSLAP